MRYILILLSILYLVSCSEFGDGRNRVTIPDFNFPTSIQFEELLSSYDIFEGAPSDLIPSEEFHLLELSSVLYTDYAHKQRLIKIPAGSIIEKKDNGSLIFPEGTILTKTFYYNLDERNLSLGRRIIETRLLIKNADIWNVATYKWNEEQDEAYLLLDGEDLEMSWTDKSGDQFNTLYHIPTQNECMTCHQSNNKMSPLGPTLVNLNRTVSRNGENINLLNHLQSISILSNFDIQSIPSMVDYKDLNADINEAGRAYLAMNCSHCHNPTGWDASSERDFDFRITTPYIDTGIEFEKDKIIDAVLNEEMPFIGTTLPDRQGIDLLIRYIESL